MSHLNEVCFMVSLQGHLACLTSAKERDLNSEGVRLYFFLFIKEKKVQGYFLS